MTRVPGPGAGDLGDPVAGASLRRAFAHAVARHEQRLIGLLDLARALSVRTAPSDLTELALLNLMGNLGSSRGAIWLLDEAEGGALRLMQTHGTDTAAALACTEGLRAWCARPVDELPALASLDGPVPGLDEGTRSVLSIAGLQILGTLMVDAGALGVVAIGAPAGGGTVSSFDQYALHTALRMLGAAWENAVLYRALERRSLELEHANADLREMDRIKSEFLSNVNHELRTPIAVVSGAVACLRHLVPTEGESLRFLEMIDVQADRLGGMVQGLLDFGHLSSASLTLERSPMDLGSIVTACVHKHRAALQRGGRTLEAAAAGAQVVADSDAMRVAGILDQLIGNAVKFTPPGTTIRIEARTEVEDGLAWACLRVSDDGPGIDPEMQERIFQPFVQGDGSSTRRAGGMGLGLALARSTAERLSGALEVHSAPGSGATFVLRLPTPRPAAATGPGDAPDAAAA